MDISSLINRSSVTYELRDWPHRSSSLRCRWAPLGPGIRPGWKHPVFRTRLVRKTGKTGKTVFDKYFLRPKNIVIWKKCFNTMWYSLLCIRTIFGQRKWSKVTTLSIQKYSPILKSCHLQLCKISRIYIQGYIIGSILCTMNKETPYDASKKYFYYFWNGWLLKLFGWRKYLTKRGKQNMGPWYFVRKAF